MAHSHAARDERFAPQGANGNADLARYIVDGTGSKNHTSLNSDLPNSIKRNSTTFGTLNLTLHPTSYDWQFLPDGKGGSFTDSGSAPCH
jgi:hypothetical protein